MTPHPGHESQFIYPDAGDSYAENMSIRARQESFFEVKLMLEKDAAGMAHHGRMRTPNARLIDMGLRSDLVASIVQYDHRAIPEAKAAKPLRVKYAT